MWRRRGDAVADFHAEQAVGHGRVQAAVYWIRAIASRPSAAVTRWVAPVRDGAEVPRAWVGEKARAEVSHVIQRATSNARPLAGVVVVSPLNPGRRIRCPSLAAVRAASGIG